MENTKSTIDAQESLNFSPSYQIESTNPNAVVKNSIN